MVLAWIHGSFATTSRGLRRVNTIPASRARVHTRAPTNSMYPKKSMTQHSPAAAADAPAAPGAGRRIQMRRSGIHGKGVYAVTPFRKGELVVEYKGEVITWPEALRRHPHDPDDPFHTFYFHIDDDHVIDGKHHGNVAKWINHSCAPNCEAETDSGRVFVRALRALKPGEELFYDYGLVIDERYTPKLKKQYACHCGSKQCRGTMLAPKR